MITLKLIAALLHYPSEDLQAMAPVMAPLIEGDPRLTAGQQARLLRFAGRIAATELMALQEEYVDIFDRGRACSLHLFEHVHGESRDRGQAMVDLAQMYEQAGFEIGIPELPDYLPLFLEFLSTRPVEEGREWLSEIAHILQPLYVRLTERGSPYACLIEPLLTLAGAELSADQLEALRGQAPDDASPEALDQAWAEQPVTFGLGSGGCPSEQVHRPQPSQIQWATKP